MRESDCPMVLWDYCIERRALIAYATAKDNYKLQGATAQMQRSVSHPIFLICAGDDTNGTTTVTIPPFPDQERCLANA